MKKKIIAIAVAVILIGGGSFYAGMAYSQSQRPASIRTQQFGANAAGGQRGAGLRANGGGVVAGDIISKDDKSITIKLASGGTEIIFFSDSAKITKSVEGATADLEVGKTVFVGGTKNSDGSLTASTIQLGSLTLPAAK